MKKIKLLTALLTFFITNTIFSTNHIVNTQGMSFVPSSLTINVGDSVTFINNDGFHNVNGTTTSFPNNPESFINPQGVSTGWTYSKVFTVAGSYDYQCDPHIPGMVGTILVNTNTIYDIVSNSADHTTLKTAIDACSLEGALSGSDPLTLFAPTNAAFDLLPEGTLDALLSDISALTSILQHHVVSGAVISNMLSDNQIVTTLLGTDVTVTIDESGIFIDNAQVILADQMAQNGVVHVIDAVLLPTKDCKGVFNGIATYDDCGVCHESYMYEGMGVLTTVATYADTVGLSGTFVLAGSPMDVGSNPNWNDCPSTIYDIVSNSADHTTLKTAIDACSLEGALSGSDPLTLFAPTNAAFDLLPEGTLDALLSDISALTSILQHHVVSGAVISNMLSDNQIVTTLLGTDVTVTIDESGIFIDNAQVIVADLIAQNGAVHVIDAVLLPSTTSVNESLNLSEPKLLYSLNLLGKKVKKSTENQIIFDVYSNGSVIKRFNR